VDLFGEIPVLWSDVLAWCEVVSARNFTDRFFLHYVRGWNVVEKIRCAKLEGTFDAVLESAARLRERFEPREPVLYADGKSEGRALQREPERNGDRERAEDRIYKPGFHWPGERARCATFTTTATRPKRRPNQNAASP
jgi:hypothetical protein